jgi:hypothetical protein
MPEGGERRKKLPGRARLWRANSLVGALRNLLPSASGVRAQHRERIYEGNVMAGTAKHFVEGHSRGTLVSTTALSVPGSTGLGTVNVQQYFRFTGLFSVVGSLLFLHDSGFRIESPGRECFDRRSW